MPVHVKNNDWIKVLVESKKYIITPDGHIYKRKSGKEVGKIISTNGYKLYSMHTDEGRKNLLVHRIIWYLYGDSPLSDTLVINHKDGNKLNNNIKNLEQITASENLLHRYHVLKIPAVVRNRKLDKEKVAEIRALQKEGWIYKDLAKKYNVSIATIECVVNNKIWK